MLDVSVDVIKVSIETVMEVSETYGDETDLSLHGACGYDHCFQCTDHKWQCSDSCYEADPDTFSKDFDEDTYQHPSCSTTITNISKESEQYR